MCIRDRYQQLKEKLAELRLRLSGDPIRRQLNESTTPSISGRVGQIAYGHWDTRQAPTQTFQNNLDLATSAFAQFETDLKGYLEEVGQYEADLAAAVLLILGGGGFDEDYKTDSCYYGRKVATKHLKDLAKNNLRGLTRRIGTRIQRIERFLYLICSRSCSFCLLYTSPSPRDATLSRMPSSA